MSKMRKFKVASHPAPNSDINITPLVDVVLVLLIIFMVVTPLLEKDIEVRVPDTEVDAPTPPPEDQLVVSITKEGQLSINADKVTEGEYVESLRKILIGKAKADRLVFFTADDETNYGKLVAALDGARQAGAEVLGMATDKIAPAAAPTPQ